MLETLGAIGTVASGVGSLLGASKDYSGGGVRMAKLGNTLDTKHFKLRHEYMWNQAKKKGMTPQEFYGSPAAGGNAPSGTANMLGNAKAAENSVNQQKIAAANSGLAQLGVALQGQKTQKEIAEIQAETERYKADKSSGATIQAANISAATQTSIANRQYDLAIKRMRQIDIPKLQADLKISAQQFKKLSNEIATTKPKFLLYMKKLSMGVDNMIVEFLQHSYGVNITDPKSVQAMSPGLRKQFIADTAALSSKAFQESAGVVKTISNAITGFGEGVQKLFANPHENEKPATMGRPKPNSRREYFGR